MRNSWTGGQYSIFRILLGAYLFAHFVHLAPWAWELFSSEGMLPDSRQSPLFGVFANIFRLADTPGFVVAVVIAAAAASLLFLAGVADKWAAFFLWLVLASLFGRNPLIANPSLPYVGWMLLAHLFIPSAPYGSWVARGRPDPGGGWRFPAAVFLAGWIVLALSYSYSGYSKLLSPSWGVRRRRGLRAAKSAGARLLSARFPAVAAAHSRDARHLGHLVCGVAVRAHRAVPPRPSMGVERDAGGAIRLRLPAEFR